MDSTLNDFLNEINEIAPLKTTNKQGEWKKCFDEKSGFSYYWNTKTDKVTWEEPEDYVPSTSTKSNSSTKAAPSYPAAFPELMRQVKDSAKIYKIAPTSNTPVSSNAALRNTLPLKSAPNKLPPKRHKNSKDSDDEKITLISSYGSESESECDDDKDSDSNNSARISNQKPTKGGDKSTDILSAVRKRAEELKMIGQVDTKNIPKKIENTTQVSEPSKPKAPISGFSLVAGYDSNSEDDEEERKVIKPAVQKPESPIIENKTFSHSTLFPIVKPPDVNDFKEKQEPIVKISESRTVPENSFDTKNFQRKRRLGVSFVPTQRNNLSLPSPNMLEGERKGLGFGNTDTNSNTSTIDSSKVYSNFARGGVEFVKQDSPKQQISEEMTDDHVDMKKIEQIYEILHEKLSFLCEGNKDVTPVQIIFIQIETLFGALKADSLKPSYLHDWLEGTSEDLIKLEAEAAPEGWLLQWDRSQKRYYYHNQSTGEGQWEYPHTDVREEEAMDICTTPPPPEIEEQPPIEVKQPPLPPSPPMRSPSPPPPPIISQPDRESSPEIPVIPKITTYEIIDQPLPPGVDYTETTEFKPKTTQEKSDINSAFDSFYSELAAIENSSNTPPPPPSLIDQVPNPDALQEAAAFTEPPKKKKKKVKLGQGLSLKKKDVSKLVEKWKNVQKNF